MSREEAHRHAAAGRRRATPGRGGARRTPAQVVQPQSPLFTARTDQTAGVIRTRGRLDRIGAGVLCSVVTVLQQVGHRQIDVLLGTATVVDDDAHTLLADHARRLRSDGVCLRLSGGDP